MLDEGQRFKSNAAKVLALRHLKSLNGIMRQTRSSEMISAGHGAEAATTPDHRRRENTLAGGPARITSPRAGGEPSPEGAEIQAAEEILQSPTEMASVFCEAGRRSSEARVESRKLV